MMSNFAIACCFLDFKDEIYKHFEEIAKELQKNDIHLIIFGSWSENPVSEYFTAISIPFLLSEQARQYSNFYAASTLPMSVSAFSEFTSLDQEWGANAGGLELQYLIQRGGALWQTLFEIISPVCSISWGTTAPTSRIMMRTAQNRQIPHYVMERGFLEDTILFSVCGQTALNITNCAPDLLVPDHIAPKDLKKWNIIERYYNGAKSGRYLSENVGKFSEITQGLEAEDIIKVLYLGSNDLGTGVRFDAFSLGEKYSPSYKDSQSAYSSLLTAVKEIFPSAAVFCKPHPSDRFPIGEIEGLLQIDASQVDVHDLVKSCDIIVGLSSGTHFLSLIYGKPLITMANSFLLGQGVSYEGVFPDQLPQALKDAAASHNLEEKLKKGRYILSQVYENYLFGTNNEVPTRFKVTDIAKVVSRFKFYVPRTDKKFVNSLEDLNSFLLGASNSNSWNLREDYLNSVISKLNERVEFIESQLNEERGRHSAAHNDLLQKLEVSEFELENLRSSSSAIVADLERKDGLIEGYSSQIGDLEARLTAAKSESEDLRKYLVDRDDQLAAGRDRFSEIEAERLQLVDELQALREQVKEKDEQFEEKSRQLDAARVFSRALEVEIHELKNIISEKENEIYNIKQERLRAESLHDERIRNMEREMFAISEEYRESKLSYNDKIDEIASNFEKYRVESAQEISDLNNRLENAERYVSNVESFSLFQLLKWHQQRGKSSR